MVAPVCQIAVIVPTYNERKNLPELGAAILALDGGLQLIVVDDNSPDGTGEVADEMAARTGRVIVIHRPGKQGLGTAYTTGFQRALAMGAERVVTMDADFSHDPRYIPALVERSATCDVVIGSRYIPGGAVKLWGWERRFLSWGANTLAHLALGLQAHDCTSGYRCYRRDALARIDFHSIRADGYSYLIEILFRCQRLGLRIGETPITFVDRQLGVSKISRQEILKAAVTIVRLLWQQRSAPAFHALANSRRQ